MFTKKKKKEKEKQNLLGYVVVFEQKVWEWAQANSSWSTETKRVVLWTFSADAERASKCKHLNDRCLRSLSCSLHRHSGLAQLPSLVSCFRWMSRLMNACFLLVLCCQMSPELHPDARIQSINLGGSKPLHYFMKGQPKTTGVRPSCLWRLVCLLESLNRVFASALRVLCWFWAPLFSSYLWWLWKTADQACGQFSRIVSHWEYWLVALFSRIRDLFLILKIWFICSVIFGLVRTAVSLIFPTSSCSSSSVGSCTLWPSTTPPRKQ